MVKGCQRTMIHVKDTGSRFFEEAYFVLKSGASETFCDKGNIGENVLSEASKLADLCIGDRGNPKKKKGVKTVFLHIFLFLSGVGAGALGMYAFTVISI